ncbi:chaplin, partial [Streptomyces toxytricini]|uniref:chaplin n=1 Tax=Streptomyces toxytricini TaxID=67369 RepID=UPI00342B5703
MRQVLSRQVLGKGMLTAAAASSLLSIATGAASAHPGAVAEAAHSPGVLSGNSVSVPITLSPNVCGNSVDGGAALNPAFGNTCVNSTGSGTHHAHREYDRYLSPEHAEAFERYLQEREGRHARPGGPRDGQAPAGEGRHRAPRHAAPEQAAPAPAAPKHTAPKHAAPRAEEARHGGGPEEECDDHPQGHPAPAPLPHPAPPMPQPEPEPEPKPLPQPEPGPVGEQPAPLPMPEP